jgi:hypothetical protein
MSFLATTNDDPYGLMRLADCHVCRQPIAGQAVEHDGPVARHGDAHGDAHGEGYLYLHPGCATVMAMRLLADVMQQPHKGELRVVDMLQQRRVTLPHMEPA